MESVSVSRRIDADPDAIRATMNDAAAFMRAANFDEVTVEDDRISIANAVGFLRIELDLEVVDAPDAAFAYRQVDGIFEEMYTAYDVDGEDGAAEVTCTTEFEVAARFVGPVLDATVVKRQRRREIEAQFDYLEATTAG